jgi:hypothetical protein
VNECIDAAGHEWDPHWQRKLLSASTLLSTGPTVTDRRPYDRLRNSDGDS